MASVIGNLDEDVLALIGKILKAANEEKLRSDSKVLKKIKSRLNGCSAAELFATIARLSKTVAGLAAVDSERIRRIRELEVITKVKCFESIIIEPDIDLTDLVFESESESLARRLKKVTKEFYAEKSVDTFDTTTVSGRLPGLPDEQHEDDENSMESNVTRRKRSAADRENGGARASLKPVDVSNVEQLLTEEEIRRIINTMDPQAREEFNSYREFSQTYLRCQGCFKYGGRNQRLICRTCHQKFVSSAGRDAKAGGNLLQSYLASTEEFSDSMSA